MVVTSHAQNSPHAALQHVRLDGYSEKELDGIVYLMRDKNRREQEA